jgi:Brp/Blh family beta-carotene 15,15'-monooxygenase
MSKISIITSFVGLWLTSYLSDNNQLFFGFFLIFTFGILHGANDLVLINQISTQKKKTFFKILTSYLIIVLISVLLFTILPILALFFFIIVSAYHFGEQHWQTINVYEKSVLTKFFELVYGLLILSILLNFNRVEVSKIIVEITSINFPPYIYDIILAVVSLFFVVLTCVLYIKFERFKNVIIEQIFYLVLLTVIFKSSSLIWGFTIYFIFNQLNKFL